MSCALTVFGKQFDTRKCIEDMPDVKFDTVIKQGDIIEGRSAPTHYGLVAIEVSGAEHFMISEAADDAIDFLQSKAEIVKRLKSRPDVQEVYLDFGMQCKPDGTPAFGRFPTSLLAEAAKLGVAIEMTVLAGGNEYYEADEEEDEDEDTAVASPFAVSEEEPIGVR